jgi:hypothetical protein
MTSEPPRSREHVRTVARIVALAESYGCTDLTALGADVSVIVRAEFLAHEREVRSVEERWRRRMHRGVKPPNSG